MLNLIYLRLLKRRLDAFFASDNTEHSNLLSGGRRLLENHTSKRIKITFPLAVGLKQMGRKPAAEGFNSLPKCLRLEFINTRDAS